MWWVLAVCVCYFFWFYCIPNFCCLCSCLCVRSLLWKTWDLFASVLTEGTLWRRMIPLFLHTCLVLEIWLYYSGQSILSLHWHYLFYSVAPITSWHIVVGDGIWHSALWHWCCLAVKHCLAPPGTFRPVSTTSLTDAWPQLMRVNHSVRNAHDDQELFASASCASSSLKFVWPKVAGFWAQYQCWLHLQWH